MTNTEKPDLFDRIIRWRCLAWFAPFFAKHREALLYVLFGGLAFLLNIGLFAGLNRVLSVGPFINNCICWVACVLFQFFTNRTWVFPRKTDSAKAFWLQMLGFFGGRIGTLVAEEIILAVGLGLMHLPEMPVKLLGQVVVIVLNYVVSKLWVFKAPKNS